MTPGTIVLVDGLRWTVVKPCKPGSPVFRLELLEECDPYPVGQVGFAHVDQMVLPP